MNTIKIQLIVLSLACTAAFAQFSKYREFAFYVRSDYTPSNAAIDTSYVVQNSTSLYERVTSKTPAVLSQQHFWSYETSPETFLTWHSLSRTVLSNGDTSISTSDGNGRSSSSPPTDMGTISYYYTNMLGTARQAMIRGKDTWKVPPYSESNDYRLRIVYQRLRDSSFLYANFHVVPNTQFLLTPSLECLRFSFGGEPDIPQFTKGMGVVSEEWLSTYQSSLCGNGTTVVPPRIPLPEETATWTQASVSNIGLKLESVGLFSIPLPPGSGGTNTWIPPIIDELRTKHLRFQGNPGLVYLVQSSDDGIAWNIIGMADEASPGIYEFEDKTVSQRMRLFKILIAE